MDGALPYEAVAEIAVVTLPNGHEVCVTVGGDIIYRSGPYADRWFAFVTARQVAEQAARFAQHGNSQ